MGVMQVCETSVQCEVCWKSSHVRQSLLLGSGLVVKGCIKRTVFHMRGDRKSMHECMQLLMKPFLEQLRRLQTEMNILS